MYLLVYFVAYSVY